MPCYKREKSLDTRSKRDTHERDALAPKPVRPRSMRYHGLFGMSLVAQHLVVDDTWSPASLTEQFACFSQLLTRHILYKRHESESNHHHLIKKYKKLKLMCSDGHLKLQNISTGENAHMIRNILSEHKDMQRLYQSMPVHLVVDNINQRTFVMRKERDRLEYRLHQRKQEYKNLLVTRAKVENLVRYENEFVLEEDLQSRILLKKIENSNVRLKAIKTINTTYRKMVQVLLQDEIFYEPILHSLDSDMEEQSNFIKNILHLGMPAIAKFKILNREYHSLENKSRKSLQDKIQFLASLSKPSTIVDPHAAKEPVRENNLNDRRKRYVRDTKSMSKLRHQLTYVEKIIKNLKLESLCSQAKEIYPRIKSQMKNNDMKKRGIVSDLELKKILLVKKKCAGLFAEVLLNNLSEEEINRLERIQLLKVILAADVKFEEHTIEHLRRTADIYVMLRMCLWNLVEILRSIDREPRILQTQYPNSYLKLPLLKFDMLNMIAVSPNSYELNMDNVMMVVKRKVHKLIKRFRDFKVTDAKKCTEEYHLAFIKTIGQYEDSDNENEGAIDLAGDLLYDKTMSTIPSSKQIKAQSVRVVEEAIKREEENP